MSAEIVALHPGTAPDIRHSVSPQSIEFVGTLLIAMADSMNGRRHGQQMDPCRCTMQMLDLIKEIDQAPVKR